MNYYNVAIIGVGGLGARHLQALQNISVPISIQAVDVSEESLDNAKKVCGEITNENIVSIEYLQDISYLNRQLDVVIIATSSNTRKAVIEYLLENRTVKYLILEKVLFQKMDDYEYIENLLKEKNVKTWVNCPRRMYKSYDDLRNALAKQGKLSFLIQGANWGLGCNLIHMLDMIDYITNSQQDIVCNGDLLDAEVLESKRKGYIEFSGTVSGSIGGSTFVITSASAGDFPVTIHVIGQDIICIIREYERKIFIATKESNWKFVEKPFEMQYQSQLSNILVEDLIKTSSCSLPTYEISKKLHVNILDMFLKHLNKNGIERIEICPIT
ncbi:Gfo/Idh/MocA family oxidoreductase [Sporomusa malonica]|uniref:Oxidoreductase family, NAD-binding Rossmann fold n=1 Tax=Sporomusa malonica TaxID=112901 RepID=A0A1W1YT08_9FIRM|nr:Gfo/Idh/MocA family oxidoreductase [Sporomusa malonica]SMC39347.1 Oxidoreductase family, NAD-binding Rossmann fold [Sporomusa malonica]